jgi:hypothetical protein
VAEAPYVEIDGDRIMIHNFRKFDYFSKTDFRPEGSAMKPAREYRCGFCWVARRIL